MMNIVGTKIETFIESLIFSDLPIRKTKVFEHG